MLTRMAEPPPTSPVDAVPDSVDAFFESFFPAQFQRHRKLFPDVAESVPATFVVEGQGAWSFWLQDGKLAVRAEKHPQTRLQAVFRPDDFEGIVMQRARHEIATQGTVSETSLGPFRFLFSLDGKADRFANDDGSLLFVARDGDKKHQLGIVFGAQTMPQEPRAALHLKLDDLLALLNQRVSGTRLFLTRRLRIKGELAYALKANSLLS